RLDLAPASLTEHWRDADESAFDAGDSELVREVRELAPGAPVGGEHDAGIDRAEDVRQPRGELRLDPASQAVRFVAPIRRSIEIAVDVEEQHANARSLPSKELRVSLDVDAVLGRNVIIEIDRGDRALRFARAAVDAFVGIHEHLDPGKAAAAFGR